MFNISNISKRKRFIIASFTLTIVSILFQLFYEDYGIFAIILTGLITYLVSYLAIYEDIQGIEHLTLFALPVLFVLGINIFITIIPDRKIYRYPLYLTIPIVMYSILLAENIFNVAATRTIQLLRAAHAVVYLVTLVTAFFLFSNILALHLDLWQNILAIFLIILLLTVQFLWSYDLTSQLTLRTITYVIILSLVFVQLTTILNFYPVSTAFGALFLIAAYYVLLGILEHYYEKKLTRKPTIEYFIIACVIFIIMIFSVNWTG